MKTLILLTADHASIDSASGKLNILGAFNNVGMAEFPGRHGTMALVVRIGADIGDSTDEQALTATLMDEDGMEILKITGSFMLPISLDGSRPHFDMVAELKNLRFPHPGKYVFRISVGDEELGSTPIDIIKLDR